MRATYIQDAAEWMAGFSFSTKVKVRFSETDMYGHVNNTKVFAYFEYARIEYFKALGFNFTLWIGNRKYARCGRHSVRLFERSVL